jgi:hypothetical protein
VWIGTESLASTGIRSLDCTARRYIDCAIPAHGNEVGAVNVVDEMQKLANGVETACGPNGGLEVAQENDRL